MRLAFPHSFLQPSPHHQVARTPLSRKMSPNCETPTSSLSTSLRFVPSLACIAEEEPKVIGIRKITVPGSSKPFQVQIPLYDLNIYAPEPPKQPLPDSYQRLLAEMDQYIGGHQNSEMYKEMVRFAFILELFFYFALCFRPKIYDTKLQWNKQKIIDFR